VKITDVTTRLIAVNASPWYTEVGTLHPEGAPQFWEYPLIIISTDEGLEGYATGYDTYGGGRIIANLIREQYRPMLLGQDPLHHEALWHEMRRANRHLRNARDATSGLLDIALWDIKGKLARMSIGVLLGLQRTKVATYATCSPLQLRTPEHAYEAAQRAQALGYRGFKLQLWDTPELDIPRLRAAREAVGPGFPLMLDASGIHSYIDALAIGRMLDELGYTWYEEPIPDQQIGMLRRLAQELKTPILAGETTTVHDLPEYLRHEAVDMVRGDAYIKGGITGLRKALAMCELFGYSLEIHAAATPLADVANLHVACSVTNCEFLEHHLGHRMFSLFGMTEPLLEIDGEGYQHLPTKPGLGVELDWEWIKHHTVDVI